MVVTEICLFAFKLVVILSSYVTQVFREKFEVGDLIKDHVESGDTSLYCHYDKKLKPANPTSLFKVPVK